MYCLYCPHCQQELSVEEDHQHAETRCRHCGVVLRSSDMQTVCPQVVVKWVSDELSE